MADGSMLGGMRAQERAAHLYSAEDYLRARGDRAMAASLFHSSALLVTRRECLRMRRETLRILATHLDKSDTESLHHLGERAADYYRAHGRLRQLASRLGQRIDRHSGNVANLA